MRVAAGGSPVAPGVGLGADDGAGPAWACGVGVAACGSDRGGRGAAARPPPPRAARDTGDGRRSQRTRRPSGRRARPGPAHDRAGAGSPDRARRGGSRTIGVVRGERPAGRVGGRDAVRIGARGERGLARRLGGTVGRARRRAPPRGTAGAASRWRGRRRRDGAAAMLADGLSRSPGAVGRRRGTDRWRPRSPGQAVGAAGADARTGRVGGRIGRVGDSDGSGHRPEGYRPAGAAAVAARGRRMSRRKRKNPGDDLFSRKAALSVSSALESLTSVFGMGTGVASPLESPGSFASGRCRQRLDARSRDRAGAVNGSSISSESVGSDHDLPATDPWSVAEEVKPSTISTAQLHPSPDFHMRPIKQVVSLRSYPVDPVGNLISRRASHLDAFSAYPDRT